MRYYPDMSDPYDAEEVARLNPQPWQLECLRYNPPYVSWGVGEDYMIARSQWGSPVTKETFVERFSLDHLNEVVNFYFFIARDNRKCAACGGTGYAPPAKRLYEQWYGNAPFRPEETGSTPFTPDHPEIQRLAERNTDGISVGDEARRLTTLFNNAWMHHLNQDDVNALWEKQRLFDFPGDECPTAAQVNEWSIRGLGHDSLDADHCVQAKCERLGYPAECERCGGHGNLYEAEARLSLMLWVLHPRKGASRGMEIRNIQQSELKEVFAYLREAAQRNADRFSKIPMPDPA